jgi:hypothetical protein
MEYYSAMKNKMSFIGKWMGLEITMLSEISPIRKANITCLLSYEECRPKKNDMNLKGEGLLGGKESQWEGKKQKDRVIGVCEYDQSTLHACIKVN